MGAWENSTEVKSEGVALVVPTRNAGSLWDAWLEAFHRQTLKPERFVILDSGSTDGTPEKAKRYGFEVWDIPPKTFDHGGTRQMALEALADAQILVYMSQDAVLASPKALEKLLRAFADPAIGAAYGRQLPRPGARPTEAHLRFFNYPPASRVSSLEDVQVRGVKAAFVSNSFSAYRRIALENVGGFPLRIVMGEDAVAGAKLLLGGWKIAYEAEATVYHSHNYTPWQEFRRYFDIGTFHAQESWMLERLGKLQSEGLRYARSEIAFLWRNAPLSIPESLLRLFLKYLGYRLGREQARLPLWFKRHLSANPTFWDGGGG